MTYLLRAMASDLLDSVKARSSRDDLTQEWLDAILPELMAYLLSGPAACKRETWKTWDDLPDAVQSILVGVISRHSSQGASQVSEERIGDYQIRYSDPALFEGRVPRFFNDGENTALSRLAGCFGRLYTVDTAGVPLHDFSTPEDIVQGGGSLPASTDWVIEPASHANGWRAVKKLRNP